MDDVSLGTLAPATLAGAVATGVLLTGGAGPVAALLARLDAEHPVLSGLPARERLLDAAWFGSYRCARTRRAYAGDLEVAAVLLVEEPHGAMVERSC